MTHKTRFLLASAIAIFVGAQGSNAMADALHFTNKDRISGQVIDMTDPFGIHFKTSYGQTLLVPWSDLSGVYDQNDAAIPSDMIGKSRKEIAAMVGTSEAELAKAPLAQKIESVTSVAAIAKESIEDKPLLFSAPTILGAKWKGRLNLGLGIQDGNSETEEYNVDVKTSANWDDIHRVTLKGEYHHEKENDTETENNRSLDAIYDYFFQPKWFLNNTVGLEQDDIAKLDLRADIGLGLGYQPYQSDALNLGVTLGPSYLYEEYETGDTDESTAGRWTLDYDQRVWDDMFQIFHAHEVFVPAKDAKSYVLETETGVRIPIRGGIVGTAQIDFDRDNNPDAGVKKDDTEYTLKLGYEW